MKKIIWLVCFVLSIAIANVAYGDTADDIAIGVSTESLSRIRIGMSVNEVEQIIGREADSVFEIPSLVTVPGVDIPPSFHHTWYGDDSEQIWVAFHNNRVLSTHSLGLDATPNYHVSAGAGSRTVLTRETTPSTPQNFWLTQGGIWFATVGIAVVALLIVGIYEMYNRTKPQVYREVRVIARRVRSNWWFGRSWRITHGRPTLIIEFMEMETGKSIKKVLPQSDRELFEYVNIGDEGILTTQGALYVSFIRTKILGN